ncbi:MAG: ABC transporter ATP-binding protein [Candidatus Marinimicrobia bacterium]|nr:ABC transporter ATP-binding protein [Candidatus Neomarinimicrobiota bacterium]
MSNLAIQINDLTKSYGKVEALKGVSLSIPEGCFYGLLGPNGAGKTTTINILTGLVLREGGTTSVFGRDTIHDYRFTRSKIGIAAQELSVDWFFSIEKLLYFHAGYYGMTKKVAKPRVDYLLDLLGLSEKKESRLRQLSGGMKRRFQLAKALVHDPDIIILDEPTAGVDVGLRHELWDLLRNLHKQGKTILLTTHYIEEAELLCKEVAIIDQGIVIAQDSPKALIQQLGKAGISINLSGSPDHLQDQLSKFTFTQKDNRLHFTVKDPDKAMPEIISTLVKNGCHIHSIETEKSSLEDVFLSLTGKGINE